MQFAIGIPADHVFRGEQHDLEETLRQPDEQCLQMGSLPHRGDEPTRGWPPDHRTRGRRSRVAGGAPRIRSAAPGSMRRCRRPAWGSPWCTIWRVSTAVPSCSGAPAPGAAGGVDPPGRLTYSSTRAKTSPSRASHFYLFTPLYLLGWRRPASTGRMGISLLQPGRNLPGNAGLSPFRLLKEAGDPSLKDFPSLD